jgi:hypothetical protein
MTIEKSSNDSSEIQRVLSMLLDNMVVAAFEYAAGFRIRLERELSEGSPNNLLPFHLTLDLRGNWWVGERAEWISLMNGLPLKARRGEPDAPFMAFRLMLMVGATITEVTIATDSSLSLSTSDGEVLHVEGKEAVFEESWLIEAPPDIPGYDQWYVGCGSQGQLFAKWRE